MTQPQSSGAQPPSEKPASTSAEKREDGQTAKSTGTDSTPTKRKAPTTEKKPSGSSQTVSSMSLDKEVGKQALQSVSTISTNAGKADAAQINADRDTSNATIDALKEGMKNAETAEERRWYAEQIRETDKLQKQASSNAADRSTQTQRGFMKVAVGLALATISLGALKLLKK